MSARAHALFELKLGLHLGDKHKLRLKHKKFKPCFHMIARDRRIAGITEALDRSRSPTIARSLKSASIYNR